MLFNTLLVSYGDKFKDENGDKHYVYDDVWTGYAQSSLMTVFLWVAVALAVILIGVGIFVRFKQKEKLGGYIKTAIALAVGFAVTVIVAMLALEFFNMSEKERVYDILLYPAIVLFAVILLGIAASYVGSLYSKKVFKITLITSVALMGAALVAFLACLIVYYTSGNAEENAGVSITGSENLALYLCAAGLIAAIVLLAIFLGKGEKKGFDSKSISYAAICIALSFALSYIKIFELPQGGSVTIASLLPLMIYSYMYGVRKGVFAGLIYGMLQAIQDPYIVHPAQFLLDYPLAFAMIGLSGVFAKVRKLDRLPQLQFALGAVAASVLRFLCHFFAGVFAFSEWSNLDNVWVYSLGYNSFVFVDIAIVVAAGLVVFSSRAFVKEVRKFRPKEEAPQPPQAEESETK